MTGTPAQGDVMDLKGVLHVVPIGFADGLNVWDEDRRADADPEGPQGVARRAGAMGGAGRDLRSWVGGR